MKTPLHQKILPCKIKPLSIQSLIHMFYMSTHKEYNVSKSNSEKTLWLSGNEAIARGAWQAGVTIAAGYPGTPSTEILENLVKYDDVYCEWAPNEKVALESALGACFAGARVLATMKHVGLNVAADPLFTSSYTGVRGGIVIVNADDPEMHSS